MKKFVVLALFLNLICFANIQAIEKKWTFMVYLNADNDLDSFGVDDLQEMVSGGGSNEFRNIVCLVDRLREPATLYHVKSDGPEIIKNIGEIDMGNYKEFVKFVVESAKAYPADHYAAIIWNHGSGWKDIKGEVIKSISQDYSSQNAITTEQLSKALKEIEEALGKKLDLLGFDACLMQMAEVAYAVKDHCNYIVGSEENEPGEGWCYDEIGKNWKKDANPEQLAGLIVESYAKSYSKGKIDERESTTQSALNCSKFDNFCDAMNGFCKSLMANDFSNKIRPIIKKEGEVQKFFYRTNIDLGHFVHLAKKSIKDESFQIAAMKLEKSLSELVIAHAVSGTQTKHATGLAIYFPASSYSFSSRYKELAFAKETMWEEMVLDYYVKSASEKILAEVSEGNVNGLREYISTANHKNKSVTAELVRRLNFSVFSENKIVDSSTRNQVVNLLKELKAK